METQTVKIKSKSKQNCYSSMDYECWNYNKLWPWNQKRNNWCSLSIISIMIIKPKQRQFTQTSFCHSYICILQKLYSNAFGQICTLKIYIALDKILNQKVVSASKLCLLFDAIFTRQLFWQSQKVSNNLKLSNLSSVKCFALLCFNFFNLIFVIMQRHSCIEALLKCSNVGLWMLWYGVCLARLKSFSVSICHRLKFLFISITMIISQSYNVSAALIQCLNPVSKSVYWTEKYRFIKEESSYHVSWDKLTAEAASLKWVYQHNAEIHALKAII